MSIKFKSANGGSNTLTVKQNLGDQVHFLAVSNSGERGGCAISRAEVPALVLAILEASGIIPAHSDSWTVGEPDNLARIAADLQHHIERRDARTKEAADREALELRRDELVQRFSGGATRRYLSASPISQAAIDYIINLEGQAAK